MDGDEWSLETMASRRAVLYILPKGIEMIRLANISNGLVYPHDDVCYFQSCYGHHMSQGYFRIDSMPLRAVIALLTGDSIAIIDATRRHKKYTDALKYGVPTWCLVFNKAIGLKQVRVCDWATPEMIRLAHSDFHDKTTHTIRKLINAYGWSRPAVIGDNVILECYQGAEWDDHPDRIAKKLLKV